MWQLNRGHSPLSLINVTAPRSQPTLLSTALSSLAQATRSISTSCTHFNCTSKDKLFCQGNKCNHLCTFQWALLRVLSVPLYHGLWRLFALLWPIERQLLQLLDCSMTKWMRMPLQLAQLTYQPRRSLSCWAGGHMFRSSEQGSSDDASHQLEKKHVFQVYDSIASHFSRTR